MFHRTVNQHLSHSVVKKRQKDISDIDQKIISMYAKGMDDPANIRNHAKISTVFEKHQKALFQTLQIKSCPQIEDWQNRPLDEVYPILYIDAIHYSVQR